MHRAEIACASSAATAQAARDSLAEAVWFHRMLASGMTDTIHVAGAMLRSPSLGDEAMRLLRAQLRGEERGADAR